MSDETSLAYSAKDICTQRAGNWPKRTWAIQTSANVAAEPSGRCRLVSQRMADRMEGLVEGACEGRLTW